MIEENQTADDGNICHREEISCDERLALQDPVKVWNPMDSFVALMPAPIGILVFLGVESQTRHGMMKGYAHGFKKIDFRPPHHCMNKTLLFGRPTGKNCRTAARVAQKMQVFELSALTDFRDRSDCSNIMIDSA